MNEYRFITKHLARFRNLPQEMQVLQIKDQQDVSRHEDIYPIMIDVWRDADRWEAEEFLRSKQNV